MLEIKLVSPCCQKPLEIKSLDDVAVVRLHEPEPESDPEDDSYGWNTRCCQEYLDPEKVTARDYENERRAVFMASVREAEKELEARLDVLRREHTQALHDFSEVHDPDVPRVYVYAMWGENTKTGQIYHNHREGDSEERDEAMTGFNQRCEELLDIGFDELVFADGNASMYLKRRTFKKDDVMKHVGIWKKNVGYSKRG